MINSRRFITAIFGAIVFTTSVYADMMPMSLMDGRPQKSSDNFSCQTAFQHTSLSGSSNYLSVANLDLWSVEFYPEASSDLSNSSKLQPPKILTNKLGSLNLCISALISLGLCSSVNWMKKHSFGFIPEWYHSGGPHQIGHSFAVTPDFLRTAPAFCFIQPVYTVEDSIPQYRLRTIVSLWRKSQFTPIVIASRGPPDMS